jgi:hypothetical protein
MNENSKKIIEEGGWKRDEVEQRNPIIFLITPYPKKKLS